MAVRNVLEEKIRLYVEAAGDEELKRLVDGLGDLGDVADEQAGAARKAMQRLADAMDALGKVDAFDKLKRKVQDTETELEEAQQAAQALFKSMAGADKVSPQMERQQQAAARRVRELSAAAQQQRIQLQQLRGALASSGVDTTRLGTAQGQLRRQMGEARTALASAARSVGQYRTEATRAAAEVPAANERIARSYDGIGGALQRLRSLAAPVLAFLTFRGAAQGVKALADVQQQLEDARRAMGELYGGQEEGNKVFERLEVLAKRNGLAIGDIVEQAKRMKAFGIDPLNGSLQALVDQNAAAGGSLQDLEGKVLAVGQAWAKQKLQGEEILQLVERGVPVWDLLQKATGKNVQELQKLSEKGELGRSTIQALMDEIGRANEGAANRSLGTLTGLLSQASARWLEFKQQVVEAGLGQYLKDQLGQMLGATGDMAGLAKRVSDAIIGSIEALRQLGATLLPLAKEIGSAAVFLGRHAQAVMYLAQAYAALKFTQWATGFNAIAIAQNSSAKAAQSLAVANARLATDFGRLGSIMAKVPRVLRLSVYAIGLPAAIHGYQELARVINERIEAAKLEQEYERNQLALREEQATRAAQLQREGSKYAQTRVRDSQEIQRMTELEGKGYVASLEMAQRYWSGAIMAARVAGDKMGESLARERYDQLGAAIKGAAAELERMGAAAARENRFVTFAASAGTAFDEVVTKGKSAADAVKGIFDGLQMTRPEDVAKASAVFVEIEGKSKQAAEAIRLELRHQLDQVATKDFPALEGAARFAMDAGVKGAKELVSEIQKADFRRLGVDVDAVKSGFTEMGRSAVDSFRRVVDSIDDMGFTAEQRAAAIAQAFDNAFRQASTRSELASLKAALQDALSAGDLGFQEFQRRVTEADAKLSELAGTAASVPAAIEQGMGSLGDQLSQVARSAEQATDDMAKGVDGVGKSSEKAAEGVQKADYAIGGLTDELIKAYFATNRYVSTIDTGLWSQAMNRITAEANAQAAAIGRLNAAMDEELAKQDPLTQALEKLKDQYPYVQEAQLRATAEKQARLEDQKRRAMEEAQQIRAEAQRTADAARQAQADSAGAGASLSQPIEDVLRIEWSVPSKSTATAASAAEAEQAERQASLVLPILMRRLDQAQARSMVRRRG